MSDQLDEDALSVQLETSLTLDEEEDLPSTSSTHETPNRTQVRKSRLGSILLPVKASPFKNDKDLRKGVLIRNLRTTQKKDEDDATNSELHSEEKKNIMQQEEGLGTEEKVPSISVRDDVPELDVIAKPEDDIKTTQLRDEKHVVVDETHSVISSLVEIPPPLPSLEKQKPVKKPCGLDVDYVSKDPLENADNNNPDWQLLQKLETDEERYKAVRERWRNLIVPEPNKDLTCFTWCRKKYSEPKKVKESFGKEVSTCASDEDNYKGRKRTFSACAIDSPIRRSREAKTSQKRVRTVSCTRVYEDKIATLRRHVSEECLKIDREHMYALEGLEKKYLSDKRSLSNWSLNTGYSISKELNDLDRYHYQKRRNITNSYEDLSSKVWEGKASEITTLEAASEEVLAFHKFYQGLDDKNPESMVLTEEQLDEIQEINSMYDAFYKYYEE